MSFGGLKIKKSLKRVRTCSQKNGSIGVSKDLEFDALSKNAKT
jgi:hypothetical protein